jgi:hypothetical protein
MLSAGQMTRAVIPAGVTVVHLQSDRAPLTGDHPMLGALLRHIRLDNTPIDLADKRLTRGFHEVEQHGEVA